MNRNDRNADLWKMPEDENHEPSSNHDRKERQDSDGDVSSGGQVIWVIFALILITGGVFSLFSGFDLFMRAETSFHQIYAMMHYILAALLIIPGFIMIMLAGKT